MGKQVARRRICCCWLPASPSVHRRRWVEGRSFQLVVIGCREQKEHEDVLLHRRPRHSATHRQVLLPIQQRCEEVGPESRQLPLLEQDRLHPRADQSSWQRVPRPVARGAGRSGPSRRGGRGGARQRLQALGPSFFCLARCSYRTSSPPRASKYLEGARTTGQAPAVYSASCEHCFLWQLVSAFAYQA